MHYLPLIAVAVLVLLAAEKLLKGRTHYKTYEAIPFVLTSAEVKFFKFLKAAVSKNHSIFPKVRQADFLKCVVSQDNPNFFPAFNQICRKHVDFLICDKETSAPLLVVELNDSSHNNVKTIKRDDMLKKALKEAGIKYIPIKCRQFYDVDEIRNKLYEHGIFPDEKQEKGDQQEESRNKSFFRRVLVKSNDKHIQADKDTKPQPMRPERKAVSIPSNSVVHPDSRYMPKV